jgi:hypothetical protein
MSFVFEPLAPDKTRVVSDYFFGDAADDDAVDGLTAFLADVGEEDRVPVESVQRRLTSPRVPAVRMLLDSEKLLRHCQLLVSCDLHRQAHTSHGASRCAQQAGGSTMVPVRTT